MLRYERRDLDQTHWHLGPVAVEPAFQHAGIGSRLLERFCAAVDEAGGVVYLETDVADNIRLYERFGFELIGEESILGVSNWFMLRGTRGVGR
jgi:ribosomal protein S18 acetylase RimI-like enzyme